MRAVSVEEAKGHIGPGILWILGSLGEVTRDGVQNCPGGRKCPRHFYSFPDCFLSIYHAPGTHLTSEPQSPHL